MDPNLVSQTRLGYNAPVSKRARIVTSDEQIEAAIAAAKVREGLRPRAVSAKYRPGKDAFVIALATGVEIVIPRKLLQGLENATPAQAAEVEIWGPGDSLHWESIDVDHYVPSLIEGVFGNRRWMSEIGKIGGSVRSEAKRKAARKNGSKGGRPRVQA